MMEATTGVLTTIVEEVSQCHSIAVDWLTGALYYTSMFSIVACHQNKDMTTKGKQCVVVLYSDDLEPWHLVLYPPGG